MNIIEFFGTPGIGKTHLSNELAKSLKLKGFNDLKSISSLHDLNSAKRRIIKLKYILIFIIRDFNVFIELLYIFCSNIFNINCIKVFMNFLFIFGYISAEATSKSLLLLDQGYWQAHWSTIFRNVEISTDSVSRVFDKFLRNHNVEKYIILDVEMDAACHLSQLKSRQNGKSPLENASVEQFVQGVEIAAKVRESMQITCMSGIISNIEIHRIINKQNVRNTIMLDIVSRHFM
jgi:hypothetical protein